MSNRDSSSMIFNILDFGAQPNSNTDTVPAVKEVLAIIAQENPSKSKIIFPKGEYHFFPKDSFKREYFMSNTSDINPKNCGILVEKLKNLEICGEETTFIYHDRMSAFTLDNSDNIRIEGINIDWERPLGSECRVLEVTKKYIDIELDAKQYPYYIKNKRIRFTAENSESKWMGVMEYNPEDQVIPINTGDSSLGWNWRSYRAKKLDENRVRLKCRFENRPKVGNILIMRHHERDHAGIFVQNSKNIKVKDVNMYANAGLGILAQYTENLHLDNLNFIPNRSKRAFLSCHDDGAQISNCKGEVIIENCVFEGLMDDPINCHGTSVKIMKILSDKSLEAKFIHHQSIGMKWGDVGDSVSFLNHSTMESLSTSKITNIRHTSNSNFIVEFNELIPSEIQPSDALENLTWSPNLLVKNCKFLSSRARGILISTPGKVVIENNYFKSSGSAILVAGDANGWYESGAVTDVTIRNNDFSEYCLANLYQFCEGIISIYPIIPKPDPSKPFHRNITIENNHFHPFDYPVIYALSTQNLIIQGNHIERSNKYQPFHKRKATISLETCQNVVIKNNELEKDVLGKNAEISKMKETEIIIAPDQGISLKKKK